MRNSIDETNDAHKLFQCRREVYDQLRARLSAIDEELVAIDKHAQANQGQTPYPPQIKRAPVDVLLDKVATQDALKEAKHRVDEAEATYIRLKAAE